MYPTTSNPPVARTRSLRVPPSSSLKPMPAAAASSQSTQGISNVSLFLTNLRLLDLDRQKDWPDITNETLSTKKDAQQNQKKRIQCVEWALYQLFAIWDPEETRNACGSFFWSSAKLTIMLETPTLLSSHRAFAVSQPSNRPFSKSRSCEKVGRFGTGHPIKEDDVG